MADRPTTMVLLVGATLGALGQATPPLDPTRPGPYHVGSLSMTIVDNDRSERRLLTEVWYPTQVERRGPRLRYGTGIPTRAVRGARPAPGPFPLIVFSHGLTGVREQSAFLTEHLASHGYVVAAPDHQYNTARDFRPTLIYQSGLDRPMDLRIVLDRMEALSADPSHLLYRAIRPGTAAAIGHSLGGYTVLTLGGALAHVRGLPIETGNTDYVDFSDDRIRAVVAMSPVYRPAFTPTGLARCRVPVLVLSGSLDKVTSLEEHQRPIFDQLRSPRYLAVLEGATHFSFCDEEMVAHAPFFIRRLHRATIPRPEADAFVRAVVLAFLDRHFDGRDRYADQLVGRPPLVIELAGPNGSQSLPHRGRRCD